jgi:hypothetical protein
MARRAFAGNLTFSAYWEAELLNLPAACQHRRAMA